MNNNQISNPKKEVQKGMTLNEKDYINSLLSCLKEMEKNYTIAMTEASNEYLYKEYLQIFNEISSLGRETYELMFRNGFNPFINLMKDGMNPGSMLCLAILGGLITIFSFIWGII